jgi:hypothetical protein
MRHQLKQEMLYVFAIAVYVNVVLANKKRQVDIRGNLFNKKIKGEKA